MSSLSVLLVLELMLAVSKVYASLDLLCPMLWLSLSLSKQSTQSDPFDLKNVESDEYPGNNIKSETKSDGGKCV
jgi:hypothetical protein